MALNVIIKTTKEDKVSLVVGQTLDDEKAKDIQVTHAGKTSIRKADGSLSNSECIVEIFTKDELRGTTYDLENQD